MKDTLAPRLLDHALKKSNENTGKTTPIQPRDLSEINVDNEIAEFSRRSLKSELNLFETKFAPLKKERILEEQENQKSENNLKEIRKFEKQVEKKYKVKDKKLVPRKLKESESRRNKRSSFSWRRKSKSVKKVVSQKRKNDKNKEKNHSKKFYMRRSLRNLF